MIGDTFDRLLDGDVLVWEVECKCGYLAQGWRSAGWTGLIPVPPGACRECGRSLMVRRGGHHGPRGGTRAD